MVVIRWRRGLFRLWMILTVVWVLGVMFSNGGAFIDAAAGRYGFIENKGDMAYGYGSKEYTAAQRAKKKGLMQELELPGAPDIKLFVLSTPSTRDLEPVLKHFTPIAVGLYERRVREVRSGIISHTALWIWLWPLGWLAIGSAIAWPLSGYPRPKMTPRTTAARDPVTWDE